MAATLYDICSLRLKLIFTTIQDQTIVKTLNLDFNY